MKQPDQQQIAASRAILDRSQQEGVPYDVNVCGIPFVVLPGVFSPRYFDSTQIFSSAIKIETGQTFLEVGCGAGATSVLMALRGASRVLAVDINEVAVKNTLDNIRRHRVEEVVETRQSDVFSAIEPSERFDAIYWNLPFIYVPEGYEYRSVLERALYDPDYVYTARFMSQAASHLEIGGRLFLGFADFGDIELLRHLANEFRWSLNAIARGSGAEGGPVTFILFECRLLTP